MTALVSIPLWWLKLALSIVCFIQCGESLMLRPVHPNHVVGGSLMDGHPLSRLDLQSTETFFWSGTQDARTIAASLTVFMEDDNEKILASEKFDSLLIPNSTECTSTSIKVTFQDRETFDYAVREWAWVNADANRSFVLAEGSGHCIGSVDRIPFVVSNIHEQANEVTLMGQFSTWLRVAHDYELSVGRVSTQATTPRAQHNYSFRLGFDHHLPNNTAHVPLRDGVSVSLACLNCTTTGAFDFQFHVTTRSRIPTAVSMLLAARDVSANMAPHIEISGDLTGSASNVLPILKVPADGLSIPGIFNMHPMVDVNIGYTLDHVVGSATISTGVYVGLDNGPTQLTIDLLPPHMSQSGWKPTLRVQPIKVSAPITGGVQLSTTAGIDLDMKALGYSFKASVDLDPFAGATLGMVGSTASVCHNDADEVGIELAPSAGVNFAVHAPPLFSKTWHMAATTLPTECLGFRVATGAAPTPLPPPSASRLEKRGLGTA